jgi:hypothetical protein
MITCTVSGKLMASSAAKPGKKRHSVLIDGDWIGVFTTDVAEFAAKVVDGQVKDLPLRVSAYTVTDDKDVAVKNDKGFIETQVSFSFAGSRSILEKLMPPAAAPDKVLAGIVGE